MKYLLVSSNTKKAYILQRLQEEGEEVLLLTKNEHLENLVPSTTSPDKALEWNPDIAIFTDIGAGTYAKYLQDHGVKVIGSGLLHDNLATDPEYASVLASRVKVPIFDISNGGTDFYLAGFYSAKGFVGPCFSYSVDKGLLPNGKTQEALVMHALSKDILLVQETFGKLEKLFTAFKFAGVVLLHLEIDSETGIPHIKKLSVKVPSNFWAAFITGLKQPLSKFFYGLANGKRFDVKYSDDIVCAVKVTLPPYPHVKFSWLSEEESTLIERLLAKGAAGRKLNLPQLNVFPVNVLKKDDEYYTTGYEVALVGAEGSLVDLPYMVSNSINLLELQGAQWRKEFGKSLATSLSYCERSGYLSKEQKNWNASRKRKKVKINES